MPHTNSHALLSSSRAVSSTIGAVVLVGIVIALGAGIGSVVTTIGSDVDETAPNTGVDFTYNSTTEQVTVFHGGGKLLTQSNTGVLRVRGDYSGGGQWNSESFTGAPPQLTQDEAEVGSTINATEVIWQSDSGAVKSGETVRLVWVSGSGAKSEQLGQFTAP